MFFGEGVGNKYICMSFFFIYLFFYKIIINLPENAKNNPSVLNEEYW